MKIEPLTEDASLIAHRSAALWCLRVTYCMRCVGLGDAYLWNPLERESDIFSVLMFDCQWPEATAARFEDAAMWLIAVSGIVICFLPMVCPSHWRWPKWSAEVLLLGCLLWEICLAAAPVMRGGTFLPQWTPAAHALRMGVPLALLLWPHQHARDPVLAVSVLRFATALTFLAHGVEAVLLDPSFVTMLIAAYEHAMGGEFSQASAESIIRVIGAIDIALAAALLWWRSRWLALYMALWGLLTACSRMMGVSLTAYPETLLRLVHAGGPLALALVWWRTK